MAKSTTKRDETEALFDQLDRDRFLESRSLRTLFESVASNSQSCRIAPAVLALVALGAEVEATQIQFSIAKGRKGLSEAEVFRTEAVLSSIGQISSEAIADILVSNCACTAR